MVDARLTPLAAMGLDRGTLIHDGLRLHGGVVYPGIRTLQAEKNREAGVLPLGYNRDGLPELVYKPDGSLDSRKATNGYLGLYKGIPPNLHKPVLIPGAESLSLERRLAPGEKAPEMGLAGTGSSYLRLPWLNPYPEASMYPFIDSSKYALNMYKASLLSQPNPYLPQHLAYPSLCGPQGGTVNPVAVTSAAERLYYMPTYPPPAMSSPLVAPQMRIPPVSVAPTSLVHCQDKGLGVGPPFVQQLHQPSPLPQHHPSAIDRERSPNRSGRPSRPPSRTGSNSTGSTSTSATSGGNNSLPTDSSPHASTRLSQTLIDNSLDLQRPVARMGQPPVSSASISSSPATQPISHLLSVSSIASEQPSPARPRPRDGAPGAERRPSRSPSKSAHPPQATKESGEKPLDLSGRILEFGLPNGFPIKMDTIAPGARYGLPPSGELLKENLSLSPSSHPHSVVNSTSSKVSERPEMISTLHSSWVVPSQSPSQTQHAPGLSPSPRPNVDLGSSQAKGSSPSVIKHKNLERVLPQPRSSSCPRISEPNSVSSDSSFITTRGLSPKSNGDWSKHSPLQSDHVPVMGHHREGAEKNVKRTEAIPEASSYKRPLLENGHPAGPLYLPQSDAYLTHSLAYANRYLHYPIPDSMALHSLPIAGKGPVYPHPMLLGSNSLYPTHLATKPPLPYHNLPPGSGGEYLAYNSQEMSHPLMQPHSEKLSEKGDSSLKPRGHEKTRSSFEEREKKDMREGSQIKANKEAIAQGQSASQAKTSSPSVAYREKIECIDLVHSDTDAESTPTVQKAPSGESSAFDQNERYPSNQNKTRAEYEATFHLPFHSLSGHSPAQKAHPVDGPQETPYGKPKVQDAGCPGGTPNDQGKREEEEDSSEEQCPSPDPADDDQSTLRCARTSGERSSGKDKKERDSRTPHFTPNCTVMAKEANRDALTCRDAEMEDSLVDLGESQGEGEDEDDDDGQNAKGSRRSSLAKRIANSSGYVGDRFKCVTTELYADSSKLSREQRALQMEVISREGSNISQPAANWERAMMRFSELELKEKEGGGCSGGGNVCVSAPTAGRELAEGQRRERALEFGQYATRQGEREGVLLAYPNNRVTVLQRCDGARRPDSDGGTSGSAASRESPEEALGHDRKRLRVLKMEQDSELEEEERMFLPQKRSRMSADEHEQTSADEDDEEVRKLKVCIELKGLRLSKPAQGGASPDRPPIKQEQPWSRLLGPAQTQQRADINRKWGCERLLNGVAAPPLHPGGQVKDRAHPPPGPFSGDRGLKEPRRGPPSPGAEPSPGGAPPLKLRRHSDTDKPKGKRPCKTKHTGPRERERRKEGEPNSPGRRFAADLETAEDDKPSERREAPRKRAASPNGYPGSPVEPCSPAALCPPPPHPQADGRAVGVSPEVVGAHRMPDAPAARPVPPEARRLIVNKNAGETLLQRAARLGYEEVVLYCLENRVCEVNHRDYAGYCALHEACARGWLSIVQHLLDYGADINCSAQDGTRPIHDAVENDHLDVVRVLLSYGADPTLATYSGRGLLKMTHSDIMERFLTDYFADLQGSADDDPGLYWEFYGSAVCESAEEGGAYDILADPPGPDEDDEDDKREVFEFEFSDRPLLPCYNIQVSVSHGPRNWLLLSDVLRRLRMSARGFRQAFPHMEVVTVSEAEFYRQASLSQLFSCPEELEGFQPDSKELLDLVEDSAELAALLGSTLECLDDRWEQARDKLKDRIKAAGQVGLLLHNKH
ncbi:BCL-6 corepressor isoform X1 [Corythoichthys intestinalis]|uniref:BCL-6 corepressor isoform X1 n=1 Tax=Corythoichthys intestinalis TaxID=161448 RepID=UPI0025A509DD|nr:BCL-6 corepressor isoform X1 [Corythoichthys intestinalis]XP_057709448.1 BCL-6 corepressor isoform X1 [Corythoichthys intestinalis]